MNSLSTNQKSLIESMKRSDQHTARGFQLLVGSDKALEFFEPLKEAGFFAAEKNPPPQESDRTGFFRIPFWPALEYLEKIAGIANQTADPDLGAALMEIVRAVTLAEPPTDNYHTFRACAEITGLVPLSSVTIDDMDMVRVWLGSRWGNDIVVPELDKGIFRRYLADGDGRVPQMVARALWHTTELIPDPARANKLRLVADDYWLEELLKNNAERLGVRVNALAMDCFVERLRELFTEEFISTRTWMIRAAIEEHPQNSSWDHANNAIINGARNALLAWVESDQDAAKPYVATLLSDSSQIVRRLALNAIDEHWEALHQVFTSTISRALFDIGHLHELYLLLSNHFASLSIEDRNRVVAAILEIGSNVDGDDAQQRANAQIRNWLASIAGKGSSVADERFNELQRDLGPLREHPDLLSYTTTRWGFGDATFSKEQLVGYAQDGTLLEKYASLEPDTFHHSRKSEIDQLINAASEEPEPFLRIIEHIDSAPRDVVYAIFSGIEKAISAKEKPLEPRRLEQVARTSLVAAITLAQSAGFWAEEVTEAEPLTPTRDWIPPVLAGLGKSIVGNETIQVRPEDITSIRMLNDILMSNSEGIPFGDDFMTPAINNPRGQAFESTVHALLRACRDSDAAAAGHSSVWSEFEQVFERELASCQDANFEVSTLCACYVNQLLYASEGWTLRNMPRLFPLQHAKSFAAAISGLSYAAISRRLYESLQSNDVIQPALLSPLVTGGARERLIERIAVAYSWGQEALYSPVIIGLFVEERLDDLTEFVSTSSRWASEKLDEKQVKRGLALAAATAKFGLENPRTRKQLLSHVARFIGYVASPTDEVLAWLVQVAPYAHLSHGEFEFIDQIERLAEEYPSQMALVLEAFLHDYQFTYDYRNKLARTIRKIFVGGERAKALAALELLNARSVHPAMIELLAELRGRNET